MLSQLTPPGKISIISDVWGLMYLLPLQKNVASCDVWDCSTRTGLCQGWVAHWCCFHLHQLLGAFQVKRSSVQLFPKILSYLNCQINVSINLATQICPCKPLYWFKTGALHRTSFKKYTETVAGVAWRRHDTLSVKPPLSTLWTDSAPLPRTRWCAVCTWQSFVWHMWRKTHLCPCPILLQYPWWVAGHILGITLHYWEQESQEPVSNLPWLEIKCLIVSQVKLSLTESHWL